MRTYRPTEPLTLTYYAARRYGSDAPTLSAVVSVSGLADGPDGWDIPVSGDMTYSLARDLVLYVAGVRGYDLEDADWHYLAADLTDTGRAMGWASDLTPDAPLVLIAD